MKTMKRVLSVLMTIAMLASLLAGCGSSSAPTTSSGDQTKVEAPAADGSRKTPDKTYVIGIAEAQANDEVTTRRKYLESYIAPNYNVKFIFSETLKDDAAVKTFIENCIDSGVDAVIDFKSATGALAQLCKDNGIVYTINGNYVSSPELQSTTYDNFSGCVGANNPQVGSLFKEWLEANASADGSEGFLISTSLASSGNTQHIEIAKAILQGLQEKYGLTYTKTIDELYASAETINAENDKGITITLYPGSPNKETWLPGISALIQTGNYGIVMSSGQTYNQSATVVNEVEASTGKNIKVASIGALGGTLNTAFNTPDPFGNSSIDLCAVKSVSALTACLFAITYNQLTGFGTQMRDANGIPVYFTFNFIGIESAEQLASMDGWDDRDAQNWIVTTDIIDQMIGIYNPNVTADSINEIMGGMTYEGIASWMK